MIKAVDTIKAVNIQSSQRFSATALMSIINAASLCQNPSWNNSGAGYLVKASDIQYSDKFSKAKYKNQVTKRGWNNQKIANTINNSVKTRQSVNKYTGNTVTAYYIDDVHYVAVDNLTKKVIQVADMNKKNWQFDLSK